MDIREIKVQIEQKIQGLTTDLEKYAKKDNASQFYIDKENKLINFLISIINSIEHVEYSDQMVILFKEIRKAVANDSSLNAISIQLRITPDGNHFYYINQNLEKC